MSTISSGLPLETELPPLREVEGGAVRVGKTRVSLDVVVQQYENGMSPEEMVWVYDTLTLADVYGTIAYYLRHRKEVETYMKRRAEEAEALRTEIEAQRPRITREALLARRAAMEQSNAAVGQ
jgi:uncharacterized protein (DUF433 family)